MKKLFLFFFAVVSVLTAAATDVWIWNGGKYTKTSVDSLTFIDPEFANSTTDKIEDAGKEVFEGTLKLSVMGFSAGSATPVVTIKDANTGLATVSFDDFSASGYAISGFSADDVQVETNADGSYSFSRSNFTTTALLNGEEGELSKCNLTGSVQTDGSIDLSVSFSVSSFPVSGTYSGNKIGK